MPQVFPRVAAVVCVLFVAIASARGQAWELQLDEDGLPVVARQGVVVAKSSMMFWGGGWQFAGAGLRAEVKGLGQAAIRGHARDLHLFVDGTVEPVGSNQLKYTWHIDPRQPLKDVIGGGLEFHVMHGAAAAPDGAGEPVLLEGNRGWAWPVGDGADVRVEFEPALPKVYFERGRKHQIRAFFIDGSADAGRKTYTMTVTLPQDAKVVRSLAERYGPVDLKAWHKDALRPHQSPVDLSFLNHKPAGKHGFVRADGDRFVFEDGTPVRFWGGNLAAYTLFSGKEQIAAHAKRISQLGFNLMRFHHHDSMGWVRPTVIRRDHPDSQHMDPHGLDAIDWWIKCLKDEGVYVWLDLHVGRLFKPGDAIEGFSDLDMQDAGGADGRGFNYFNPRIEDLMREFNVRYLTHVNPYTGLAYQDDPAIVGVLLTNENDITFHFGNLMLPDKYNPYHQARFEEAADAFAAKHELDAEAVRQSWRPGVGKLFLADHEHAWNVRMIEPLRQLGLRAPIATTPMWADMPLYGLPPLMAGDVIDVHSYGGEESLSANPRFTGNWLIDVAAGAAHGKPVTVSEWNVEHPTVDRFTGPLYMASIAALQGWDAPMIYNYAQIALGNVDRQDKWSTFSDPAITAIMPAAALLYREGHVADAQKHYLVQLDRERAFFKESTPGGRAALRSLVEQSKLTIGFPPTPELPWLEPAEPKGGEIVVSDLDQSFLAPDATRVVSDTGELTRDWSEGWQMIDTPRTQAVHGWIGGRTLSTRDAEFALTTPKAAVALSPLDGLPLSESRRILLTAVGRAQAGGDGRMPMNSEPIAGELRVRAASGLRLRAIGGSGADLGVVDAPYEGDAYRITLPPAKGTHWWVLREE